MGCKAIINAFKAPETPNETDKKLPIEKVHTVKVPAIKI